MIQITVLHVSPITWGSFKHASWEELQVSLRYSGSHVNLSINVQVSKYVKPTINIQTHHQSLHVNTDMLKYRSRTNHQLQHTFYPIKQVSETQTKLWASQCLLCCSPTFCTVVECVHNCVLLSTCSKLAKGGHLPSCNWFFAKRGGPFVGSILGCPRDINPQEGRMWW